MKGNQITALAALFLIIGISGIAAAQDVEIPSESFSDLMDRYDEEAGDFSGLEPGDPFSFSDIVSVSKLGGDGDTDVWFESTGGGMYRPHLTYPGEQTERLEAGTEVLITVHIVNITVGNRTVEDIDASLEDITVLKEPDEDRIFDGETIDIFGFKIDMDWLPEDLHTPLIKFALVFAAWTLITILLWFVFQIALKLANKTRTDMDAKVINIVRTPFFIILLLYGLLISLSMLDLPDSMLDTLSKLYSAVTIAMVAFIVIKVFKKVVMVYLTILSEKTETKADDVLVPVIGKMATVVIWIIAIIMFLDVFGIDITIFVAGLGIAGLVIAFAAQDTLSNFFSGLMILLDRPFKEGDWIQMDDKVYQVRDVGLRSTKLFHAFSNQVITIPNNRISDHMFSNLNMPDLYGRSTVKVGVSYGSDPSKVGGILLDVVRSNPETYEDKDHAPFYRFNDFGDSSLDFGVTYWIKDVNEQWRVASNIRESIFHRFEKEGIEIPFPQRVVHMANGTGGDKPGEGSPNYEMGNLSP